MNCSVDYEAFLSQHDLLWKSLPKSIFEGPFLGNGETGAAMYFDGNNDLYINIGNTDIYDNRTADCGEKSALFLTPRLPLGGFRIKTDGGFIGTDMRLSLYDAKTLGTLEAKNGNVSFSSFVTEGESAFVFTWNENGAKIEVEYDACEAISPRQSKLLYEGNKDRISKHYEASKAASDKTVDGVSVHVQPKFNGGEYSVAYKVFENDNEKTLVCVIGNSETGDTSVCGAKKVLEIYSELCEHKAVHKKFWHEFYKNSFLSLDDTMIEGFYWIQLYKCASATRSDKRVFDTAGPWLPKMTSWPGTWWNLNVELNYSPLYVSNHLDIASSLPNQIKKHLGELKDNVPNKYRNGEYCVVGRCTGVSFDSPSSIPGECKEENELELGNLLWALHNCYVHFSSECNNEALKNELYPVLKGAADYIINFLYVGEDGLLHLYPTASPEFPGIGTDCNYNLSLLRWGLITLEKLREEYGICDESAEKHREVLSKLADYPYDSRDGFKISAEIPLDDSHRHYSHLLMFYPLHILDESNAENREKIIKSINHWQSMPEGLQGYSQSGAASMYAVLGDGNKAYKHLMNLFSGFVAPNTMYEEGENPVLETPPAAAKSVLDMLLLSFGEEIRVFTGTPDVWQNVCFSSLLCENGCTVSAKRENGKTVYIKITAKEQCAVHLKVGDLADDVCCSKEYAVKDGFFEFNLMGGESFELAAPGVDKTIAPVKCDESKINCFGLS